MWDSSFIHPEHPRRYETDTDAHRRWDNTEGIKEHDNQLLMIEYNDEQRSCDTTSAAAEDDDAHAQTSLHSHQLMIESNDEETSCDTGSAAEDATAGAQTSYHDTRFTERNNDPAMDTKQNVSTNVVDTQDDEDDHIYNWFKLFRIFVHWIFGKRY